MLESLQDIPPVPIPIKDLFIDYSYHQRLRPHAVQVIADPYSPRQRAIADPPPLGALLVTQRSDGRYSIIDGAHRFAGVKRARRLGWTRIEVMACVVVTLSDRRAEAEFHLRLNSPPR